MSQMIHKINSLNNYTDTFKNKLLEENNKKAYELLLRIQSQLDATKVIATSTSKLNSYE